MQKKCNRLIVLSCFCGAPASGGHSERDRDPEDPEGAPQHRVVPRDRPPRPGPVHSHGVCPRCAAVIGMPDRNCKACLCLPPADDHLSRYKGCF